MRTHDHLKDAEECERIAQTAEDPVLRSIYRDMAELYRQLDLEMQRLADWHREHPRGGDIPYLKPRR